ncbi:phenoloxidase-activating factor 2-like [Contarinia nasturtii]|uniref:phenoloxidase-activating factor 2-like n=1 Tax=Contarinia nasturtii TaxID=265458 RepID=UPI0012D3D15B|nr:phenoloxidase-activating factor 2-like [Contarinia nasturtii]
MERLAFSYTLLVVFSVVFNNFQPCQTFPEDAQIQSTVQQDVGSLGSRFDTDEPAANRDVNQEIDVKKCGIPNQMGLNKYGLEFLSSAHSKAGEFPWTVAILRKLNRDSRRETLLYSGAGALIHPSVVLTAANKHHATKMDLIRAGEWDFSSSDEEHPYQDRSIESVQNIDENDADSVQLIFVTEPFVLTNNVRTVCLPFPVAPASPSTTVASTTVIPDTRECTTAAWGQQNCSGLKGLHSILGRQSISTDNKRPNACEADWQQYLEDNTFKLKSNQFCTKRKHNIDDSCFCDHGAALFCAIQPAGEAIRYEQIGVSIASGGCTKDLPGIFSSVAEQRAAIDGIFNEKGLDTSYYTA